MLIKIGNNWINPEFVAHFHDDSSWMDDAKETFITFSGGSLVPVTGKADDIAAEINAAMGVLNDTDE